MAISGPITSWEIEREKEKAMPDFLYLGSKNHCRSWLQPWNQKTIASWQESYDKPRQHVEKQRRCSANKGPYSQGYGLPSGHVWLWEKEHKEGGAPKNWCLWTAVLKRLPRIPWLARRPDQTILRQISPELVGRTDAEAETPVFWSTDTKKLTHWKSPWCWERWG